MHEHELRLTKEGNTTTIVNAEDAQVVFNHICAETSKWLIDFEVIGHVYKNQFLVVSLVSLNGDNNMSVDQTRLFLKLLSEQLDWSKVGSPMCILEDKLKCVDCNEFPCSCSNKKAEEKILLIPFDMLSSRLKVILAKHCNSLDPNISTQLALDKDENVRGALYQYTNREILMNRGVDLARKHDEFPHVILRLKNNKHANPRFLDLLDEFYAETGVDDLSVPYNSDNFLADKQGLMQPIKDELYDEYILNLNDDESDC